MKKKTIYLGLLLLIVGYFVIDNKINKDYNDYNIIKVKDGELLILKRNNNYSVLELTDQITYPEKAEYRWCQIDSNLIVLDKDSILNFKNGITGDGVEKGKQTPIEFDNFKFYWSIHTDGEGFIYLNYYPKFNEKQGTFYWALIPQTDLTKSIIVDSESHFQIIDIKKENLVNWIWKRLKMKNN